MPTTQSEADKIVSISQEYVDPECMHALFVRLDDEVGSVSDNDSVKQSFRMFRALSAQAVEQNQQASQRAWLSMQWAVLVLFHHLLIWDNIASFFTAPFLVPWYLAFPACFAIIWTVGSSADCVLTQWENRLREKLDWRPIKYFIGHYYVRYYHILRNKLAHRHDLPV